MTLSLVGRRKIMVARFSLLTRSLLLVNLFCWLSIPPSVVHAAIQMDPKPPMRWSELIGCELVVVAKYEKHEAKTLSLRVVRVLKGKDVKPGGIVKTTLEHWYSIETGPTGTGSLRLKVKAKSDGIPKLCYKTQIYNPGPPVPVRVLSDVRQPAVYFFPKAKAPALQRRGQVQFALFADGWAQAVSGKEMDLSFRLMQRTNPPLARKALEELYRSRDPKAIASLIDWTIKQPVKMSLLHAVYFINSADRILIAIGDRDGDVYNPLMKWLTEGGKPGGEYANHRVGKVLARIDSGRAFADFSKMIKEGDAGHKKIATISLAYVQSEKAVDLCINLLENENLATDAIWALSQGLLLPQHRPRLLKAFKSAKITDHNKQQLRNSFRHLLAQPPNIDLTKAEKILLDPKAKVYHGWAEGKAYELFRDIRRAADPKFVPLLVRILREVPNAIKQNFYTYRETFSTYASLFPNAMRKELTRCGFKREIGNITPGSPSYAVSTLLWPVFGVPGNVNQLEQLVAARGPEWIKKHPLSKKMLAELKRFVEHYVADTIGPRYRYLHWLFLADPDSANDLLTKAIERRKQYRSANIRAGVIAMAIRHGHKGLVSELIQTVNEAAREARKRGGSPSYCYKFLLLSGDERAYQIYLKTLDATRRFRQWKFDNRYRLDYEYQGMLAGLRREHPKEYFKRILILLESDSYAERQFAQGELSGLDMEFGYRAKEMKPQRDKTLQNLRPILVKVAAMSAVQRRQYVLGRYGIHLKGKPNKSWLPALVRAAGHYDSAVSRTALNLIDDVTGQTGALAIFSYQYYRRERIARAWLADRGFKVE